MLDAIGQPMQVSTREGKTLYRNEALTDLIRSDAESSRIGEALRRLASSVGWRFPANGSRHTESSRSGETWKIATATCSYRLRALPLGAGLLGPASRVLILVDRRAPDRPAQLEIPPPEVLRDRFGLTARQVDVALLLAQRRTNAEVARLLQISPHTVRRHTEVVLRKMGLDSRVEVEGTLTRLGRLVGRSRAGRSAGRSDRGGASSVL